MRSALYAGRVEHARADARPHAFGYAVDYVYLDLDEIERAFAGRWLWSATRPAPVRFARADYLGDPATPLADAVRSRAAEELGRRPRGPVRLLTGLRRFGFAFNPVSFYFCFDKDGSTLDAVVAEIANTPWNERHAYVLDARVRDADGAVARRFDKAFHVSPFLPPDLLYDWRISTPGETLSVCMSCERAGAPIFSATLGLRRSEWTPRRLAGSLARFPLQPLKIFVAIYWQALRLVLKRARFHPHPKRAAARDGGTKP